VERAEWLKKMRAMAEALYDHGAPAYWEKFGLYPDATHRQFIEKFLGRLGAQSAILDAACGAGLYDGLLLEAGHRVLGIDQSGGGLARAREHFPQDRFPGLRYAKIGLQEMDFQAEYDGAICMDAMEHICPEDWPVILARFLPVVFGEVADELDELYAQAMALEALDPRALSGERLDLSVYHYHPSMQQVRAWLDQAGLAIEEELIEEEGTGEGYAHLLARKNA
jgi:SAM-dependent methyltransferase